MTSQVSYCFSQKFDKEGQLNGVIAFQRIGLCFCSWSDLLCFHSLNRYLIMHSLQRQKISNWEIRLPPTQPLWNSMTSMKQLNNINIIIYNIIIYYIIEYLYWMEGKDMGDKTEDFKEDKTNKSLRFEFGLKWKAGLLQIQRKTGTFAV